MEETVPSGDLGDSYYVRSADLEIFTCPPEADIAKVSVRRHVQMAFEAPFEGAHADADRVGDAGDFTGSPAHASAFSGPIVWMASGRFPATSHLERWRWRWRRESRCLSATGIRFLGILSRQGVQPLLRSAYRAAALGP